MQAEQNIAIGELSRRTGVNIETIRYFERVGILAKPPRPSAGRRIYGADHIRTLGLVRRARELGFTQAEVRAILSIWDPSEPGCSEARDIAVRHLEHVRQKMVDLGQLERLLSSTIARCEGDGATSCPVIDMLDQPRS